MDIGGRVELARSKVRDVERVDGADAQQDLLDHGGFRSADEHVVMQIIIFLSKHDKGFFSLLFLQALVSAQLVISRPVLLRVAIRHAALLTERLRPCFLPPQLFFFVGRDQAELLLLFQIFPIALPLLLLLFLLQDQKLVIQVAELLPEVLELEHLAEILIVQVPVGVVEQNKPNLRVDRVRDAVLDEPRVPGLEDLAPV